MKSAFALLELAAVLLDARMELAEFLELERLVRVDSAALLMVDFEMALAARELDCEAFAADREFEEAALKEDLVAEAEARLDSIELLTDCREAVRLARVLLVAAACELEMADA